MKRKNVEEATSVSMDDNGIKRHHPTAQQHEKDLILRAQKNSVTTCPVVSTDACLRLSNEAASMLNLAFGDMYTHTTDYQKVFSIVPMCRLHDSVLIYGISPLRQQMPCTCLLGPLLPVPSL